MIGTLKITFEPTGKGYVFCDRTRPDGSKATGLMYKVGCPRPTLLTDAQIEEWNTAMELEMEALRAGS